MDVRAARALTERLADSITPLLAVTVDTGAGWRPDTIPENEDEHHQTLETAVGFLLEAVDWDADLIDALVVDPALSFYAERIAIVASGVIERSRG